MQNRIRYPGSAGHGGVVSRFFIGVLRPIRLIRDSAEWYMSPLWGFGYLVHAVFYKHVAPLGLSAAQLAARRPS